MKCPCEIIVWNVLPSIRAALAEELIKKGLSQNEVSGMLGITQAAVSQYTSKKRGSKINFQKVVKEEIKKLADDLMDSHVDDLMVRICEICTKVRADKTISIVDKYGTDDELNRIEYTLYRDKLKRLKRKIAEKEKLLVAFDNMPFKHKVCFTAKRYSHIRSAIHLPEYKNESCIGDIYTNHHIWKKHFDVADWLNGGTGRKEGIRNLRRLLQRFCLLMILPVDGLNYLQVNK